MNDAIRVRPSVRELQDRWEAGDTKPLDDLMRAWKGIKELPPTELKSFFTLGGYHGEPFIGPGAIDNQWWGGYCNHGNVLFPTWHRAYVLKLEQALQSIVPDVMMPYWDQTSEASLADGIPWCLTAETYELDGELIPNPLRSYVFQVGVRDDAKGDDNNYRKPISYETVRYPLSGLVGSVTAFAATQAHNAKYPDHDTNVELLNRNVVAWLTGADVEKRGSDGTPTYVSIADLYRRCLDAPTYTLFSNTVSQDAHNKDKPGAHVVALEAPHNDIHLAVGGYDFPGFEAGLIEGANGDMGENNTAALDPIFFFHHCNVDRMFWLWQKRHGCTTEFDIDAADVGARSNTLPGGQGPTPNFADDVPLTMDSPLTPFMVDETSDQRFYTSRDMIDIENQLGFTYSVGSLEDEASMSTDHEGSARRLVVHGINRALFAGSFIVRATAVIDGERHYLGHDSVLSRWNVAGCANCQTHLDHVASFSLASLTDDEVDAATFEVDVRHRGAALPPGLDLTWQVV